MPDSDDRKALSAGVRVAVIVPVLRGEAEGSLNVRAPEARLEEASGLVRAIGLVVAHAECVKLNSPRPGTLLGAGKIDIVREKMEELDAELLVVDGPLTPIQQRNLENLLDFKVIDRTALILEIFGKRARTREGRLQVELAALSYQRTRLVRSWTHLERQRGGSGFLGGPGETQIESDRRQIDDRIIRIKRALEQVSRTRTLHRKARKRVPYPVVALVGYTNAGKSTLFNRLTGATVTAQDQLFATLDPTMRGIKLPSGRQVILSDTVGFVSDLPHDLIAAFRATLEEVLSADLILHVRDVSHPDSAAQNADVVRILGELGLSERLHTGDVIEVLNKLDKLDAEGLARITNASPKSEEIAPVAVSAITGEGMDALLQAINTRLNAARPITNVKILLENGAAQAWIYRNGEVLNRRDDDTHTWLEVRLEDADIARARQRGDIEFSTEPTLDELVAV